MVEKEKRVVEQALMNLAEECLALGKKERPEKQWLKRVYDRFRAENGQMGKRRQTSFFSGECTPQSRTNRPTR